MASSEAYDAVLVTFRRNHLLADTMWAILGQTLPPARLIVVDNADDPACQALVEGVVGGPTALSYVGAPNNGGPAAGIARGLAVLKGVRQASWTAFFDDDDPPPSPDSMETLMDFASSQRRTDPRVACVGLVGSRFDRRRARPVRLPDQLLTGSVDVDCVGGGHCPLYWNEALTEVGAPDPRLFFGFEELELGLRLRAGGWRLLVDGGALHTRRQREGRLNLNVKPAWTHSGSAWREYYSLRNIIWIACREKSPIASVLWLSLAGGIIKPLLNAIAQKDTRRLRLQVRAVRDGLTGRLGKTVPVD